MGTLSKHKTTCLTERDIQNILSIHFLTPNAKKYEMENLFVFGWESDYLCITKSDLIYECEIKIFRSDFQNDFKHKKKKSTMNTYWVEYKYSYDYIDVNGETQQDDNSGGMRFCCRKKDIKKEVIKHLLKYVIDETCSNLDVEILNCYPTTECEL